MYKKYTTLMLHTFSFQVVETAKKYGKEVAYIKGQLDEACHQLTIALRKQSKDDYHGL